MKKITKAICLCCIMALLALTFAACSFEAPEAGVTVEELKAANDIQMIVKDYGNLYIQDSMTEGSDVLYTTKKLFASGDDGLVANCTSEDAEGNIEAYTTYLDGMSYVSYADGSYSVGVIGDYAEELSAFAKLDMKSAQGIPRIKEEKIVLEVRYTEEDGSEYYDTYRFNPETLLLESFSSKHTGGDESNPVDSLYEATYTYGSDYAPGMTAYDAHMNADNKWSFEIVRAPGTENEEIIEYTVAAESRIFVVDSDFALYENLSCTREIESEETAELVRDCEFPIFYLGKTKTEALSFEYSFTQADADEFNALLAEFQSLVLDDTAASFYDMQLAYECMTDKFDYIEAQTLIGKVIYDKDNTADSAWDNYMAAYDAYQNAYNAYLETLRQLYASGAEFNRILFDGWTQEDIDELMGTDSETDEKLAELKLQNEEIEKELLELPFAGNWTVLASPLYEKLVANNQQIAQLKGYANYYEYAQKEVYTRDWDPEEIAEYRQYIKEYIVPLYEQLYNRQYKIVNELGFGKINPAVAKLEETKYGSLKPNYVSMYFDSFEGELGDRFRAMFEKNALVFVDGDNGSETAYTNYLGYYGEPYCVFGSGVYYQNAYTVVHEVGHYASFYSFDLSALSYDLAETHSQANEFLFLSYMKNHFDENIHEYLVVSKAIDTVWTIIQTSIINDFEYEIYSAETPYTASDYVGIIERLCEEYGVETRKNDVSLYTLYVSTLSPVYYISYGVSLVACLDLFSTALSDYEAAQECYRILQSDAADTDGFMSALELAGIGSPFEEQTFIKIVDALRTAKKSSAMADGGFADASEIGSSASLSKSDDCVAWYSEGDKVLFLLPVNYSAIGR